jgi:gamma-glutamyl:cysteine ligase YbdK (ATP-grasp superfamily)
MNRPEPLHLFEGVGIELEYMIVDAQTLNVKPITDEVLKAVTGSYETDYLKPGICWSNELALHVIEFKTCDPVARLERTVAPFQDDVRRVNEILKGFGARLMPSGAHPWMDPHREMRLWPHHYSQIYETYNRIFDCRGHGWANLQSAHVNLPFCGDSEFGRLHAAIRFLLPIFPALSASTPIIDGKKQPDLDHRLAVYRINSARVPSVTGAVIPEPVFTEADYRSGILQRMYDEISGLDPDGVLQDEWLNARGAIARFDRSAIEIRLLDVQECPLADLSIAALIMAAVEHFTDPGRVDIEALKKVRVAPLAAILLQNIRDGEETVIVDREYLAFFGLKGKESLTAGELWRMMMTEILGNEALPAEFHPPLELILNQGPLARRILKRAGNDFSPAALFAVYHELCECLANGVMFA